MSCLTYLFITTGFQRPIYLFHKWPLRPWRSLNVSSLNHHTYKPASCPGLQGIFWILTSYSSYSVTLKMKFKKENGTKSGNTWLGWDLLRRGTYQNPLGLQILWVRSELIRLQKSQFGQTVDEVLTQSFLWTILVLMKLSLTLGHNVFEYLWPYISTFITLFRATTSPYIHYTC